jgi:hypothetical protein
MDQEVALNSARVALAQQQTAQAEIFTKFLGSLADISIKRSAQVLGARSQRVRKERKAATAAAHGSSGCGLCDDPMRGDVSIEMIAEHRKHSPLKVQTSLPLHVNGTPDDSSEL